MQRSTLKSVVGVALAMLTLVSGTAHAADIFVVPPTDWSMQNILTPLFGAGMSFSGSPLSALMSIFNTAIVFIGGLLAAYTIVAGAAATAHDGEVLGRKWSSMWVPIRTALGCSLILPTLNGFCAAQALVLWLAVQGVGLADSLWTAYLNNFQQNAVYHSVQLDAKLRSTFESMVLSNVCYESVRAHYASADADSQGWLTAAQGSDVPSSVGATWFQNAGAAGYTYGQTAGNSGECGNVTLKLTANVAASAPAGGGLSIPMSAQTLINMPNVTAQIEQAHLAGIRGMQAAADAVAKQIVNNNESPPSAVINAALDAGVKTYSAAVSAVAQSAFNTSVNGNMVAAMSKDGWASAGSSYMRVMQAQSAVNSAVGNLPISTDGTTAGTSSMLSMFDTQVDADVKRARNVLASADQQGNGSITAGSTDGFSKIVNVVAGKNWFGTGTVDPKEDPVMLASSLGQGMIETAGGAGVAAAGLMLAAAVPGLGQAVVAGSALFGPFFSGIMTLLIVPGAALTYGEPMIPFIIFTAGVISWTIMLCEAMIGAPLAAIMLLNPHQEALGGLEKSMGLTLSLTLKPGLMIIGMCCSLLIMSPFGFFLNSFFPWAFSSTPGGLLAVVKLLAGAVIYTGLLLYVTKQVFSLITKIPDNVLEWAATATHGAVMGAAGSAAQSGTTGATAAGVGAVVGIASRVGSGAKAAKDVLAKGGNGGERGGNGGPRERGASIENPDTRTPVSQGTGRDAHPNEMTKPGTGGGQSGTLAEAKKASAAAASNAGTSDRLSGATNGNAAAGSSAATAPTPTPAQTPTDETGATPKTATAATTKPAQGDAADSKASSNAEHAERLRDALKSSAERLGKDGLRADAGEAGGGASSEAASGTAGKAGDSSGSLNAAKKSDDKV